MKPSDFTHPEAAAALRQQEIIPGFAALRKTDDKVVYKDDGYKRRCYSSL